MGIDPAAKTWSLPWGISRVAACLIAVLAVGAEARAEPYIAVRAGLQCNFCHVNETGGGKRTAAFLSAPEYFLKPVPGLFTDLEARTKHLTGNLTDWISIGTDVRVDNTTTFHDEPNSHGEVPNNKVFRPAKSNDFDITEADVYVQVDLIKDGLMLYSDESFASGTTNLELFGLLTEFLPQGFYIKAGRFFPSFGLRFQDDTAFIRSRTGFTFSNPDEGVEVGVARSGALVSASVTNGTATAGDNMGKLFCLNASYQFVDVPILRSILVGGSFARNDPADQTFYGVYLGANLWRFTFLAEGVLFREHASGQGGVNRAAIHGEANLLAFDWLNAKFAYDYFDPDLDVAQDQQNLFSIGVEPFLAKFLQFRLFYVIANGIPQKPEDNVNKLVAELHFFF